MEGADSEVAAEGGAGCVEEVGEFTVSGGLVTTTWRGGGVEKEVLLKLDKGIGVGC